MGARECDQAGLTIMLQKVKGQLPALRHSAALSAMGKVVWVQGGGAWQRN